MILPFIRSHSFTGMKLTLLVPPRFSNHLLSSERVHAFYLTDHIGRYNSTNDSFTGGADDVAEFWCNPGMFCDLFIYLFTMESH